MNDKTNLDNAVEKTELDIGVEEVTHAVAEMTKMDQVIAELHTKYSGIIFDVDKPAGMTAAKEARKEIRDPRYLIENLRKAGKKPILDLGRQLDGKAKEMTERLLTIETPIDNAIKEEEAREERERQEKIEAEVKRVEGIQARIVGIRGASEPLAWDSSADDISAVIAHVTSIDIDDSFAEFAQQAKDAKTAMLADLKERHDAAKEREAEEKRIAAEREELAKLRAAEEQRQAEARKAAEIAEAEARKKREAEEAEQRKALEAERKKQAEERARIDAEKQRLADERAALERKEAEARRKAEAAAAEKQRAEAAAQAAARKAKFPGEQAIIDVLAKHFGVPESVVLSWLSACVTAQNAQERASR